MGVRSLEDLYGQNSIGGWAVVLVSGKRASLPIQRYEFVPRSRLQFSVCEVWLKRIKINEKEDENRKNSIAF